MGELGARQHAQRHARARERRRDLVDARGDLVEDPAPQQVAHVRRDRHERRAVGDREPRQLDRLVDVDRAVVDAREQVEVELGSLHPSTVTHGPERAANGL